MRLWSVLAALAFPAVWREHLHVVMAVDSDLDNNTSTKTGHRQQGVLCAHSREHTTKDKRAKLITCSQTPTQNPCLAGPYCLSPIRLFKANPEQLLASPCDICSVGSTWNIAGWGTETGEHFTLALKTQKCSTWMGLFGQLCVFVCVLNKVDNPQLLNIFPRPTAALD